MDNCKFHLHVDIKNVRVLSPTLLGEVQDSYGTLCISLCILLARVECLQLNALELKS